METQEWRPGGAAEPPAPEAHGEGGEVLGEGVGGSAVIGPGFPIPTKKLGELLGRLPLDKARFLRKTNRIMWPGLESDARGGNAQLSSGAKAVPKPKEERICFAKSFFAL